MHRRSGFPVNITLAMFVLMWSPDFTVEGVPSRHDQCQQRGYEVACKYNTKINPCEVLTCGRSESGYSTTQQIIVLAGIPDETPCGPSKICRNKKCVDARKGMQQCPEENNLVDCMRRRTIKTRPIKTREQQCQDYGFDVECQVFPDEEIQSNVHSCRDLVCGYVTSDHRHIRYARHRLPIRLAPTFGTYCASNKACYRQKCIPLSKWPSSIPSPTYTAFESFSPCNVTKF